MESKEGWWTSHDGVIRKQVISSGNSRLHPYDGSSCKLLFIDVSFDGENAFEGCPQGGTECELIVGTNETLFERLLARLVQTMVPQEVSLCEMKLGDTKCTLKLELIDFDMKLKPLHRMTEEEKFTESEKLKSKASELIKKDSYGDAVALLQRAFRCVSWAGGNIESEGFSELYFSVVANMSLCHLKLNNNERTVDLCNCVLKHRPAHVKCLLRRATALDNLQETERAKEDILSALKVEPNNRTAEQLLSKIKKHITKQKADYAILVKKMLEVDKK